MSGFYRNASPGVIMDRRTAISHLGVAVGTAAALPIVPSRVRTQTKEEEVARWLRVTGVPGAVLGIVEDDRVTTRAFGFRRNGVPDATTADTVYAAASLTKTVFAYVFLSLVSEGAIILDRPVREYLELPNPQDDRSKRITARHLLSHSGGWRNWRNNDGQQLTSDFEPGAGWSYSGEGFFFLQRIVESVTGKSFGQHAQERLFAPLGMSRSSVVITEELEPHLAPGHNGRGDLGTPFGAGALAALRRAARERGVPPQFASVADAERALREGEPRLPVLPNFLVPNAAASMVTTASDFAKFLRHLVTSFGSTGSAATVVQQMMSPQVKAGDGIQWGLGVGLEAVGSRQFAWQWGDNPGYKNFYWADPVGKRAMCVFTNGDRGARVYERLVRAQTGVDHPAFLFL